MKGSASGEGAEGEGSDCELADEEVAWRDEPEEEPPMTGIG